jgi:hypothetical protein
MCKAIGFRNKLPAINAGAPISEASLIPGAAISEAHNHHDYCSGTSASLVAFEIGVKAPS